MSPAKLQHHIGAHHHHAHQRRVKDNKINGPRPSLVKIRNASSPSSSTNLSSVHEEEKRRRRPVIIYAHSPKVIRTEPRDFMALVQKLTGFSSSKAAAAAAPPPQQKFLTGNMNCIAGNGNGSSRSSASSSSSSCVSVSVSVSPMILNPYCHPLADEDDDGGAPLFTPSYDFYSSPPTFFTSPSGY